MSDRAEPGSAAVPETVLPASRSARAWLVLLTVLAIGLGVDLGLKRWSFETLANEPVILDRKQLLHDPYWRIPHHESFTVIPRVLELHLVENRGAVFGIGADQRIFFIVFTVGALMAAIVVFARWTTNKSHMAHLGLGLILAGGIGNLYDRVQFGVVRDFLHLFPSWTLPFGWRWRGESNEVFPWVFNLADLMLLAGMGMLMLYLNRRDRQRRAARTLAAQQADDQTQPEST